MYICSYIKTLEAVHFLFYVSDFKVQCPPLNRIALGQHESDNNNQMIQLTDVFCALSIYNRASII